MPRPSPASMRIVALLDFLADHPGESFRLSEIARRVGFNKATAHGMLAVLADAEYLSYDEPSKTFGIGPTVVTLAQAAVAHDAKFAAIAMPEMEALAASVGTQCVANVASGDEFVVIASTGRPAGGRGTHVGYRGRMMPPVGMIHHAWASLARVDVWLDRISADPSERARFRKLLAVVQERGYSISADQEAREQLDLAVAQIRDAAVDSDVRRRLSDLIAKLARGDHELIEISPDRAYRTRHISAPVFDVQGTVRMGILLTGLPELPGRQLIEYAEETVATARRITKLAAGGNITPYSG